MRSSNSWVGFRDSAVRVLLTVGPVLVLLTWFVAGQWSAAGPEPRAWLQFVGVLSVAALMPYQADHFHSRIFARG
jgi:hypothetical protein